MKSAPLMVRSGFDGVLKAAYSAKESVFKNPTISLVTACAIAAIAYYLGANRPAPTSLSINLQSIDDLPRNASCDEYLSYLFKSFQNTLQCAKQTTHASTSVDRRMAFGRTSIQHHHSSTPIVNASLAFCPTPSLNLTKSSIILESNLTKQEAVIQHNHSSTPLLNHHDSNEDVPRNSLLVKAMSCFALLGALAPFRGKKYLTSLPDFIWSNPFIFPAKLLLNFLIVLPAKLLWHTFIVIPTTLLWGCSGFGVCVADCYDIFSCNTFVEVLEVW